MAASTTHPADARWRELEEGLAWFNPSVAVALGHARAAGMDPDDLASVNFPNRASAFVTFYLAGRDELRAFDSSGERAWHT